MPSEAHDRLTMYALRWIGNRCRDTRHATEVQVARGYVADAVVLSGLEYRFYIRYCKLWGLQPISLYATSPVDVDQEYENQIAAGFVPCDFAHIFESKATRSDFLSTFGPSERHANRLEPVGTTHWVVTEKGVCQPEEVPDPWGLLVRSGSGLREVKHPKFAGYNRDRMYQLAHAILWKPDHGLGKWYRRGIPDDYIEADTQSDAQPIAAQR